jgi:ABC-type nitrate/sulfonate/bicarbonate transport system substrate-binding protein
MKKLFFALAVAALCFGTEGVFQAFAADRDPVDAILAGYEFPPLPGDQQKREINLGYYDCDHMTAACVGADSGIFEKMGLKVRTTGNGKVPEAMSAGRMDAAYAGWTTTLGAVQHGTPLFIAAENHTGGAEYLVVSHNIKKPEDLIGKKIAVGSDPDNTMNWVEWTKELGIPSDISNYQNFSMSDSDEYFAFAAGELDAFICCDPWGSMAEYEKTGWIMARQNTDRPSGHGTCCKVAMNYDFAKKYPELASRLLLAHTFCIEYMYLHPYKAAEIFAENYNVPFEVGLMTLYKKLNEEGRTIRWDLNRQYMQNQLNTMKAFRVREDINSVNLDDYVDMSYFEKSGAPNFPAFIREKVDPVFPLGMSYENWRAKAVEVDGIVE